MDILLKLFVIIFPISGLVVYGLCVIGKLKLWEPLVIPYNTDKRKKPENDGKTYDYKSRDVIRNTQRIFNYNTKQQEIYAKPNKINVAAWFFNLAYPIIPTSQKYEKYNPQQYIHAANSSTEEVSTPTTIDENHKDVKTQGLFTCSGL
jgi:hypothetical protein